MAITQNDIIRKIPRVIYGVLSINHNSHVAMVLRDLVMVGWGDCNLYQALDSTLKATIGMKETPLIFDVDTLTHCIRNCSKCDDLGYVYNFDVDADLEQYPCPHCTDNSSDKAA